MSARCVRISFGFSNVMAMSEIKLVLHFSWNSFDNHCSTAIESAFANLAGGTGWCSKWETEVTAGVGL